MPTKKETIEKIKQKKELSGIDESIVSDLLENYIKKRSIPLKTLRKSQIKVVIKEIRSELRKYTGRFQKSSKDRVSLLEKNKIKEILKTHTSTAERLEFYPKLKNKIRNMKISSILDLACGINPIALASPKIKYYASDIKQDELNLIKTYFKKNKIKGKTFVYDIRKLKPLPEADLCLIFKVLDIIEEKGHRLAEEIIKKLPCKKILISFPTKKLSGRPMTHPKRIWLEKLLERLNYNYKTFKSNNEIFYLVKKSS